jgi:hypothetical protein
VYADPDFLYAGANMGTRHLWKGQVQKAEDKKADLDKTSAGCRFSYSSRNVLAGSIPAMRRAGAVVATSVTASSVKTTIRIVGTS